MSKYKKQIQAEAAALSGRFYIKLTTKSGAEIYKDKSGKRVSKATVKKHKIKVVEFNRSTQKIQAPAKPLKQVKHSKGKVDNAESFPFIQQAYNQSISTNLAAYMSDGYEVLIKVNGQYLKAQKSDVERLQRVVGDTIKKGLKKLKKWSDYPLLTFSIAEHETLNRAFIDMDSPQFIDEDIIDEMKQESPEILNDLRNIKAQYKNTLNKYFGK